MPDESSMTGGEVVVSTLLANGIDTVFGIPGGHSLPVYHAMQKESRLRHVLGRHEQGLGYMADGYARASGRIAAVSITSGPAVANLTCPMGEATTDTSPLLVIASTPPSGIVGKNKGGLHDLNNSLELAMPVCRIAEHCDQHGEISGRIASLIHSIRHTRAGAAYLQIPTDILNEVDQAKIEVHETSLPIPDPSLLRQAADLLKQAAKPLIIAGTGAVNSGAGPVILSIAERTGAVISLTALARGLVSCGYPRVIFPDGASPSSVDRVSSEADLILAVGTMFKQEDTVNWSLNFSGKLIHIDIDRSEFGKNYPPLVAIEGDAKECCERILDYLPSAIMENPDWIAFARDRQTERLEKRMEGQSESFSLVRKLRALIPPEAMVFADRCNLGYWMFRCIPFFQPKTFHYPMGYGGLGGTLPQAIGAKLACPESLVFCIIGDGGIQFTLPELAVAVQEKTAIKIIVSNNQLYGAIKAGLKSMYGLDSDFGTRLTSPEYGLIAKAYGIPFVKCTTDEAFLTTIESEIHSDRPCLIEYQNSICDP